MRNVCFNKWSHVVEKLQKSDWRNVKRRNFTKLVQIWGQTHLVCSVQNDKRQNGCVALPEFATKSNKRKLTQTITSPRKGHHSVGRINSDESSSSKRRLRCRICKKKTSYKCARCSDPLVLCSNETGRDCWNEYHQAREYDVASSQSQAESQEIEN